MQFRKDVLLIFLGLAELSVVGEAKSAGLPPKLAFTVIGPKQTVYSYSKQRCDPDDLPDAAARAFRDSKGIVHLIAPAPLNRAMTGPDLDHLHKDCKIIYQASNDPDPSHFDDKGWLESFFTDDGVNIYGLASMDYHPDRHQQRCGTNANTRNSCWYATITAVKSTDGGYSFSAPHNGDSRFVLGPPQPFSADFTATIGALVPTNIVEFKGAFYMLVSVTADASQPTGECLMRTPDIRDVKAWRSWDGNDFKYQSVSPYLKPTDDKANSSKTGNPCVRLNDLRGTVRSLSVVAGGFVAILLDQGGQGKRSAVIAQTSTDLIHWTPPVTVIELAVYHPNGGNRGEHAYYYPSIIDGESKSLNLNEVGTSPYLYLVEYTYGAGADRDVVRFPLHVNKE